MNKCAALILSASLASGAQAGSVVGTVNAGGGRSSSAGYALEASLDSIGGGIVALPTTATNLLLTASPSPVSETGTSQLAGNATMDDATITVLTGADIGWSLVTGPILSIDADGVAAAGIVYTNTPAGARGYYLGASNTITFTVLDSNPDNLGTYAGDGLPDSWQVQYFGVNNPSAASTADPDGDGQNNQFEYTTGVSPTNAASLFVLRIESVATQPRRKRLIFSPRWSDRIYTPEFRTNFATGSYAPLIGIFTTDNGTERAITDVNAVQPVKFYRIKVTYP